MKHTSEIEKPESISFSSLEELRGIIKGIASFDNKDSDAILISRQSLLNAIEFAERLIDKANRSWTT